MLPEIVLAVGAMAAADARRLRGEQRSDARVNGSAILLLVVAGAVVVWLPPGGKLVTFGGSFVVDDLRAS